jgi:hypothetical protein
MKIGGICQVEVNRLRVILFSPEAGALRFTGDAERRFLLGAGPGPGRALRYPFVNISTILKNILKS